MLLPGCKKHDKVTEKTGNPIDEKREVKPMKKYVPLDKRSKKEQREYHSGRRRTWGEFNPVTRSVPSGKKYNRKKEKQRTGREIRNGFDAGPFHLTPISTLW